MSDQFLPKINSFDSIEARTAYVLNTSVSIVTTRNKEWILEQYDENLYEHGLNKIQLVKLNDVHVYQNNFITTLSELQTFRQPSLKKGSLDQL